MGGPHYKRVIHWFRRDLRITDNTALLAARAHAEEVIPVYVLSVWKGAHAWTGAGRQRFLCGCLEALERNLETLGGLMLYRSGPAVEALEKLILEVNAEAIFLNRDPDPFGRGVENALKQRCRHHGIAYHDYKDHVMHEGNEVLTGNGTPYRVYTPYCKNWINLEKIPPRKKPKALNTPLGLVNTLSPSLAHWKLAEDGVPTQMLKPGEREARHRMDAALRGPILHYAAKRDTPAGLTTSRLGQDLRYGLISIRELFARVRQVETETGVGCQIYLQELAWREFYFQILWHYPEVLEEAFNPDYRHLPWAWDRDLFQRWAEGMTGFPLVDAGLRQLKATGFMHNRVRMIVAMFLTKDLRLHWKMGEAHFMRHLLDGEIASNNGGWQWSAGTGADAAPYFRIQNPWTQSKRHDPNGEYIKEWLPELRGIDPKRLHEAPSAGDRLVPHYPAPMVDHAKERERTLAFFGKYRRRV